MRIALLALILAGCGDSSPDVPPADLSVVHDLSPYAPLCPDSIVQMDLPPHICTGPDTPSLCVPRGAQIGPPYCFEAEPAVAGCYDVHSNYVAVAIASCADCVEYVGNTMGANCR
jgi:hypothetical protein